MYIRTNNKQMQLNDIMLTISFIHCINKAHARIYYYKYFMAKCQHKKIYILHMYSMIRIKLKNLIVNVYTICTHICFYLCFMCSILLYIQLRLYILHMYIDWTRKTLLLLVLFIHVCIWLYK